MVELLIVSGMVFLAVAFVVFLVKFLFSLILLPIQVGIWLAKAILVLLFIVPLTIIALGAATVVVPMVFSILALPIVIGVAGIVLLIRFFV